MSCPCFVSPFIIIFFLLVSLLCRAREVVVHDVKYSTFLLVLHYLYTDEVQIQIDNAMDLFQVHATRMLFWTVFRTLVSALNVYFMDTGKIVR